MPVAGAEPQSQNEAVPGSCWTARVGQAQPAAQDSMAAGSSSSSSFGRSDVISGRITLLPVQRQGPAAEERIQLLIGTCLQSILRRCTGLLEAPPATSSTATAGHAGDTRCM